jgi:hypothetical protein
MSAAAAQRGKRSASVPQSRSFLDRDAFLEEPDMTMQKTIWGEPIGPSITAYGADGKVIVVVPFDRGAKWFTRPITSSERRAVEKAVEQAKAS